MSTLRRDLPVCFRITGSRAHALAIQRIINNSFDDSPRESRSNQSEKASSVGTLIDSFPSSATIRVPKDEDDVPEPEPPRSLPWYCLYFFMTNSQTCRGTLLFSL